MCLGVPGKVVAVHGQTATVDFFGVRRETRLDVVDEPVAPGDYILNHVGFAIRKIPPHEIQETLALYDLLLKETEGDMMAADVRGEINATPRDGKGVPHA
jgi:hydrogenase expression/formation protein HypC